MNYLERADLKREIINFQTTRTMSNELGNQLSLIAEGVYQKSRYGDVEILRQELVILVIRKIDKLDPDKNLFSYLTTCAFNLLNKQLRETKRRNEIFDKIRQENKA